MNDLEPVSQITGPNLIGTEWATLDHHRVLIDGKLGSFWVGRLFICGRQIPTFWYMNLDHFTEKDLNLVQRKVGVEDREFECLITKL